MSEFDKAANAILRGLNENFINSADDAIQHRWAKTIAHPGLGEEDEEFRVIDHSLTADGIVEEYYVDYKDELISVPADEAKVVVALEHGGKKSGDEEEDADDDKRRKKTKSMMKKMKKSLTLFAKHTVSVKREKVLMERNLNLTVDQYPISNLT